MTSRYIARRQNGWIPEELHGSIPNVLNKDTILNTTLGIQRNNKTPNSAHYNQFKNFMSKKHSKKDQKSALFDEKSLILEQKGTEIDFLSSNSMLLSYYFACENRYPFSGLPACFALISIASQRLETPEKRRLNSLFIGRSGIGKEIVNTLPEKLNSKNKDDTTIRIFDRPTIRGLEKRCEFDPLLFKNKTHIFPDLTSLDTLGKTQRNAFFSYMNRRIETDYFDDSTYFSKSHMKEAKTGIINHIGCGTPEYINKLRYNSREGLTHVTYWDRVMYYMHELSQEEIDIGDSFVQYLKTTENYTPIEIPKEILSLIKNERKFKRYKVKITEEFLPAIERIRNIIFLSKNHIREITHTKTDGKGNITDKWTETVQFAETRRSNEQAIMLVKTVSLLKNKTLKNTEITQEDIKLSIDILENAYIIPNKYWKIYYYMNKYTPWTTYKTFTENPGEYYRLSKMSVISAMKKLIELNFIEQKERPASSHENIFHLKGEEYEI